MLKILSAKHRNFIRKYLFNEIEEKMKYKKKIYEMYMYTRK